LPMLMEQAEYLGSAKRNKLFFVKWTATLRNEFSYFPLFEM